MRIWVLSRPLVYFTQFPRRPARKPRRAACPDQRGRSLLQADALENLKKIFVFLKPKTVLLPPRHTCPSSKEWFWCDHSWILISCLFLSRPVLLVIFTGWRIFRESFLHQNVGLDGGSPPGVYAGGPWNHMGTSYIVTLPTSPCNSAFLSTYSLIWCRCLKIQFMLITTSNLWLLLPLLIDLFI